MAGNQLLQIDADRLLQELSFALDLSTEGLRRLSQANPRYLEEARREIADALKLWDDDQTVPACLACGSPRVDWIDAQALYRCQDCGSEEERVAKIRRAA